MGSGKRDGKALARLIKRHRTAWRRNQRRRQASWWWATAVIVVPVGVIGTIAITALLAFVHVVDAKDRIELIKTGLTVAAGTGGVVALVLARRRQWATEHDNTERRLSDLYLKAVEQLGSDKPAVRHGALYALERVAQDNLTQRQTVVNVLCAYLRAPFHLPDPPGPRPRRGLRRPAATTTPAPKATQPLTTENDVLQEREVRLTAQRILTDHLKPGPDPRRPADTFWPDTNLDLTGATLIGLDLSRARVRDARFDNATSAAAPGSTRRSSAETSGSSRRRSRGPAGSARQNSAATPGS
ncbi:hypothetical protein [Amycolatopsis sp. CA-230715]|uniref:hypothetical protein n=1 Tax=Amycolatopsis sp. CA-230715 TaxID=2745196 RepID=UPI001C02D171|nr:hypothetical protein [Amycolatopsis sp. CA-230715]QWF85835.1 hypothetical protein HUW46_09315 [Amycolatopsis sp. CA-230715]